MCAAVVQVTNVVPLDNPSNFTNPFTFEITFESTKDLEEDLEWKLVYVGSAEDSSHDQVLVEVLVGPVASGVSKFVLHGNAPNPELVPARDLVGVTVVVLTCAYRSKEFVRVGYYVNNEMLMNGAVAATTSPGFFSKEDYADDRTAALEDDDDDDDLMMDTPPEALLEDIDLSQIARTILADKPRVTRFAIDW
eukprot:CAMPEP_0118905532 /NCGR_PEP_ID=MMETSP1166-20130328/9496_1 /TAXON_ID=1104430 /ORGANISM="Chrysoreinhardia sp, Strain CCMP3193" /LENGTH=192 /DNA_ID=CAMNT_0006844803 /DNA_START=19 /DNA_END=594 /DNA_ORIENTATION=-